MLREIFIGKRPSQFTATHPFVKAFLLSEMFLWSAHNLFMPIIAVYVIKNIKGGTLEAAASGISVYLISRVLFELISGIFISKGSDRKKILIMIVSMTFLSVSYIGFILAKDLVLLFSSYFLMGMSLGLASPARMALFSMHLDRNKETEEWSFHDALSFIGMALAGALGGFVAQAYGFRIVFSISVVLNLLAIVPYVTYFSKAEKKT